MTEIIATNLVTGRIQSFFFVLPIEEAGRVFRRDWPDWEEEECRIHQEETV